MNKPIFLITAIGLLSAVASGCAPYQPYDSYSGYSGSGYGSSYSGYHDHGHSEHHHHKDGPTKQEASVKALKDAADNGADPASTLYQQLLIRQR